MRRLQRFIPQPLLVAEDVTGAPGVFVEIPETVCGFKENLGCQRNAPPEEVFGIKGTIGGEVEKAEWMKPEV